MNATYFKHLLAIEEKGIRLGDQVEFDFADKTYVGTFIAVDSRYPDDETPYVIASELEIDQCTVEADLLDEGTFSSIDITPYYGSHWDYFSLKDIVQYKGIMSLEEILYKLSNEGADKETK